MPKVTLTFNLPDEEYDYALARNARRYLAALEQLDEDFRQRAKYQGIVWAQEARDLLHRACEDHHVRLYDEMI